MGSRIIHSIISNKIAKALSIEYKTVFLLGCIVPDAVFHTKKKTYRIS